MTASSSRRWSGRTGWPAGTVRVVVVALAVVVATPGAHAAPCEVFALDQPQVMRKGTAKPFEDGYHTAVAKALASKDLLRFTGIDDLKAAVAAYTIARPQCTCISALNVYAHGSEATLRAGCGNHKGSPHKCTNVGDNRNYYFAGGGHPGQNRDAWKDFFTQLNPSGTADFKMCSGGTIRLIGCNAGRCDRAGPFLADVAQLAGVKVLAPAVKVPGSQALVILSNPDVWQFGDPKAQAPQPCKSPAKQKAPARRRRAELLPHCFCNGTTYDDVPSCTAGCQTTLACFTGICSPQWVNETWEPYEGNPVLAGSDVAASAVSTRAALPAAATDWYRSGVSSPSVLRDGATYRMWFAGWNDDDGGTSRIGYATSADGVDWSVEPAPVFDVGIPGGFDSEDVKAPSVLYDGGVHHMWYAGFSDRDRILRATSPDGVTWTRDPVPVLDVGPEGAWDRTMVSSPSVLKEGNTFMMWYVGRSDEGDEPGWDRIGLATSLDGTHWTRSSANPVLLEGDEGAWDEYGAASPSVVRNASGYHMFYSSMNAEDWSDYGWDGYRRIGYAWSPDGITWHKNTQNPQLGPSPPFLDHDDVWNSQGIFNVSALWDPNEGLFELWGRGLSLDAAYTIGMLVAQDLDVAGGTSTTTMTATTITSTTLPGTLCASDAECDDGDRCTSDHCIDGRCSSDHEPGYPGIHCQLDKLSGFATCDPEAPRRLVRSVLRRTESVRRKLVTVEGTDRERRLRRLLKQVMRQLRAMEGILHKAERHDRLSAACASYHVGALAAARTGVTAVLQQAQALRVPGSFVEPEVATTWWEWLVAWLRFGPERSTDVAVAVRRRPARPPWRRPASEDTGAAR